MDLSDLLFLALLAGLLAVIVFVARGSVANPVTNVADDLVVDVPYTEVQSKVADLLASVQRAEIQMAIPGTYTVTYKRTPEWAWLVVVLAFPVGLLVLLLASVRYQLAISVTEEGDRTRIRVIGRVHRKFAEVIGNALEARFETASTR